VDVDGAGTRIAVLVLAMLTLAIPVSYLEDLVAEELSTTASRVFSYATESFTSLLPVELRIQELVEEVKEGVESIRGMEFTEPVRVMVINTSWAIEAWAPKEEQGIPLELLYKELVYKLTLLIPFNRSIVQAERTWVGMFLAATAGNTIYVNTDYFDPDSPGSRNVLAHELTHILQGMYFSLQCGETTDASLACSALVEGDAGWTQHLYCTETGLCTPSPPTELYLEDLYVSLNLFPYIYGERFVRFLYRSGGWSLVNRAYEKPPVSTLMVMYPEKYLDYLYGGEGVPIEPAISGEPGGELVYSDTLGPYYILLVLAKRIGVEKAESIIQYWIGDRVELYKAVDSSTKTWILVWNVTWSRADYAEYFYGNFSLVLAEYGELVEASENRVLVEAALENGTRVSFALILSNSYTLLRAEYVEGGS